MPRHKFDDGPEKMLEAMERSTDQRKLDALMARWGWWIGVSIKRGGLSKEDRKTMEAYGSRAVAFAAEMEAKGK